LKVSVGRSEVVVDDEEKKKKGMRRGQYLYTSRNEGAM
jgi:hypothetical protein